MSSNQKTLYLVDGTAYVYRAYYSVRDLTNSKGQPTGAIFGFRRQIDAIMQMSPEYLIVAFDAKGPTFRDEIYPEYKANRDPMPDELRSQFDVIRKLVPALGVASYNIEGVEADDVIATLALQASQQGIYTVIFTSDKDMAQLVTDQIILRDEKNNTELNIEGVRNKFGVRPEQMIDYLSLVGDSADNIPGIRMVGPKTAANWLNKYGTLESLIENAEELSGKAGQNFRDSFNSLDMAKRLITLKADVEVNFDPEAHRIFSPDIKSLKKIYTNYEFGTWLKSLDEEREQIEETGPQYTCVLDESEFGDLIESLRQCEAFAIDTETTGFDSFKDKLVGISVAIDPNQAFYIPVSHSYPGAPAQLSVDFVLDKFKPILEDPSISKIFHNLKFDAAVFKEYGINLAGKNHDTMLASYVFDSTAVRAHSMSNVALKYLQLKPSTYEEVAGKGKEQVTFDKVDINKAKDYAAEDAKVTCQLHDYFRQELASKAGLREVYEKIELPLTPVLQRMERNGVRLDPEALRRQSAQIDGQLIGLQRDIYADTGFEFNLSSPKQIQNALFEVLNLPILKKTPSGQPSTSEDALEDLAEQYDVPRMILEYRGLFKLKSTYTDSLAKLIHPKTQRVHTSYNQAVSATGRLSSTNPNLQNIPIGTQEGRRVREAFIASEGCRLLAIDYSQIELRIMAHLSGEPNLLNAFQNNEDVHRATASDVFGVPIDEVTAEQRRNAKAINFGLMYGMSAFGLSRQLRIEQNLAQDFIKQYFGRYPYVEAYMNNARETARDQGYVETLYHRRLHVPNINSRNYGIRQHSERTAINAPLQGSAADIIKLAMIEVDQWLQKSNCEAKLIMQVHDELVLDVPIDEMDTVRKTVCEIMEGVAQLKVPLLVEAGDGINLSEAHA